MSGKDFFQSKSNWGVIVMGGALVLEPFGVEFDVESTAGWMADTAVKVTAAAGALLALYGRLRATQPITSFLGLEKK